LSFFFSHYDVVIVGAGAAGLFCALTAGQRGRRVLVVEKANKVGKKILMSGGGRCNFTNLSIEANNYISANPHFCKAALKRFSQWDFIALVDRYGIAYEERKHGQLFCKDSAKDILNLLLEECRNANVEIQTLCELTHLAPGQQRRQDNQNQGYRVKLCQQQREFDIDCESLVIASGALSIPTLGGSGIGYDIARQFGLGIIPQRAGLVPFMFSDALKPVCERLSGLALDVEVSCNHRGFRENMLFTHRGISGPAMLQISNYWHPGDEHSINLLPTVDAAEWLIASKRQQGKVLPRTLLHQHLAKSLVAELQGLWWPESAEKSLAEFSDKQLHNLGEKLNRWLVKPSATEGYRTAEVTLGGVDTAELSSKTLEVKNRPGLFFIGEVVDVTGHLGGFNFQWAWSSGYSAGLAV
jgi:predicted Rossmann fold flavoprotein